MVMNRNVSVAMGSPSGWGLHASPPINADMTTEELELFARAEQIIACGEWRNHTTPRCCRYPSSRSRSSSWSITVCETESPDRGLHTTRPEMAEAPIIAATARSMYLNGAGPP